ncbi:MAG: flagellar basal-body rod protein FlgF [Pseudomonadota bacterium]
MSVEMAKAVQGSSRFDKKFDIIANRLANVGTTGYKAESLTFDELFQARMKIDLSQGDSQQTGNPLDIAIFGEGFFKVQTPQGDRYTRNGTFSLDKDNYLVTQDGYRVLGEGGPMVLEGGQITIGDQGDIEVDGSQVGKLKIITFPNPQNLKKEGASFLSYSGNSADERTPERVVVQQGVLEQSNVSVVTEMTNMMETTRSYESIQKILQTYGEMDTKAATEVGLVR